MSIWTITILGTAALLAGLGLGALGFAASMPRASGRTHRDTLDGREQLAVYGASVAAGAPVLTVWAIALGHVPTWALFTICIGAGALALIPAAFAPAEWLARLRPHRLALGLAAVGLCVVAITARYFQDEAIHRGSLPCFDLPTQGEIAKCRAAFARDWRLPDGVATD